LPVNPSTAILLDSVTAALRYLSNAVDAAGRFRYVRRLDETMDIFASSYNLIRHAGATWCLLTNSNSELESLSSLSGIRALGYLMQHEQRLELNGQDSIAIVQEDKAKLGATALTLLATLSAAEARYTGALATAHLLGNFIASQQHQSGRFESVYSRNPSQQQANECRYYPGEAILALSCLSRITGELSYMHAALRGALYLSGRYARLPIEHLPSDHWLMLAIEALDLIFPDAELQTCILRMAFAILRSAPLTTAGRRSFWKTDARLCATATRAEGLGAAFKVAVRREQWSAAAQIYKHLRHFGEHCLSCQVTPERAKSWPDGLAGTGGFINSPAIPVIRIDYVQHAIAALRSLLEANRLIQRLWPCRTKHNSLGPDDCDRRIRRHEP
jgi:hypothetical protein